MFCLRVKIIFILFDSDLSENVHNILASNRDDYKETEF